MPSRWTTNFGQLRSPDSSQTRGIMLDFQTAVKWQGVSACLFIRNNNFSIQSRLAALFFDVRQPSEIMDSQIHSKIETEVKLCHFGASFPKSVSRKLAVVSSLSEPPPQNTNDCDLPRSLLRPSLPFNKTAESLSKPCQKTRKSQAIEDSPSNPHSQLRNGNAERPQYRSAPDWSITRASKLKYSTASRLLTDSSTTNGWPSESKAVNELKKPVIVRTLAFGTAWIRTSPLSREPTPREISKCVVWGGGAEIEKKRRFQQEIV
jgi:hypothetical protein